MAKGSQNSLKDEYLERVVVKNNNDIPLEILIQTTEFKDNSNYKNVINNMNEEDYKNDIKNVDLDYLVKNT